MTDATTKLIDNGLAWLDEEIENQPPSYTELVERARELNEDSEPEIIDEIVKDTFHMSPTQRRRIFDAIKKQTGIPLSVLTDTMRSTSDDQSEPDQLELARAVRDNLGEKNILAASSFVWTWEDRGVWRKMEERSVRQSVHDVVPNMVSGVSKSLIDGVTDLFKTEIFRPEHEFNVGNPETVNCLNGEIQLDPNKIWKLEPHRREHYRTTQIPIEFNPKATASRFLKFLDQVFYGDSDAIEKKAAILEMIGYSFMAHCRHEKFIILVGAGANGKSVILSVLEALCGSENVAGVQPSQFDNKFQRAHLHGKLANIVTEIEQGQVIADAALKGIVSGEPTTVEHKHKDPFVMRPFATCWFGTNHMPHTRDFSDALFRRALVVPFNNVFKPELGNCDPNLKEKLIDELPGILNMALSYYAEALETGFTLPASCNDARNEWRMEADQVAQFVDDECEADPLNDIGIQTSLLFDKYLEWSKDNGIHRTLGLRGFRERLTRLGFGKSRNKRARMVTGIRFKSYQSYSDIRG